MIKKGDKFPAFDLPDEKGKRYSLEKMQGKKWVLYIYPKDLTPGCINQAINLRDGKKILKKKGYEILGLSMDSAEKHEKFIQKYELNFPLLVDTNKELIEKLGVWGPKKFMGKTFDGVHRTSFLIDENGLIESIISKVKTKEHTTQIEEEIKIINNIS